MRVLSTAEVREIDRRAVASGLPTLVLMENAALGVADAIGERFPAARRVGIVCGPGNNGADGLAVARQLASRGYDVRTLLARFGRPGSPELGTQLEILRGYQLDPVELDDEFEPELEDLAGFDLVVDALFGAGLTRPLEGSWARLVDALSHLGPPVLAIDLPSGLDGDRAAPIGPCVRATVTVTFVAPKPALVLAPANAAAGELVVADLGVPGPAAGGAGALHVLLGAELGRLVVPRPADAHKGDFGHLLLVAGSRGKAGAAVLAARAAVAGGAGLTTVAAPGELLAALVAGCPEAMSIALPGTPQGTLAAGAVEPLLAAAAERTVVAVGPGLGRAPETAAALRDFVARLERPLVLDADGLDAHAGRLEALAARRAPTVLTPHPGELGRLLGSSSAAVQADRLNAAREAARRSAAIVVLKGARTIVAAPDGEAWVNTTGNAGMASGGSGDVLTGLLGARLAQGEEPDFAACLSVHWHGLAGDLAWARLGGPALPAGALIAELGPAWRQLTGG